MARPPIETPTINHNLRARAAVRIVRLFLLIFAANAGQAQTFTVIHTFLGPEGAQPYAGVTLDSGGNLYGTALDGGTYDYGTVFRMTRHGSGWTITPIAEFDNFPHGANPLGPVVFGPDGALYGTTAHGGANGPGVVFKLQPPATFCPIATCLWQETVLASFSPLSGGADPSGPLSFDAAGNIYGTTQTGGDYGACLAGGLGCGTVFQLIKSQGWEMHTLYAFRQEADGSYPNSGVILDQAGNLYGTVPENFTGGEGGDVFELTPSGSGWTFNLLAQFGGSNGSELYGGVIFDRAGNLYGATAFGGTDNGGTVFQLAPSGAGWNLNLLFSLSGRRGEEDGPVAAVIMDSAGNLYGTTLADGTNGCGTVFKLTASDGGYSYTSLHDFDCKSDGAAPRGSVAMDAAGNLYGTTSRGGGGSCSAGCGTVWEITP